MLIDTHCHINFPDNFPDPAQAISDAKSEGVEVLIAVGCDLDSSHAALVLADAYEAVFATVGWHPNYSAGYRREDLQQLREMLAHPKAVAVGEIGLDFHWEYATRKEQDRALYDQLELARELSKPVVFHCREAYAELLHVLEGQPQHPFLFHCFAGDFSHAQRAMAMDAYFGVDGPITYMKSDELRDIVKGLPRDRIVVETDSPYLTPMPFRGKPNQPAYVRYVNAGLAAALGMEEDACAQLTTNNARRFFGL